MLYYKKRFILLTNETVAKPRLTLLTTSSKLVIK